MSAPDAEVIDQFVDVVFSKLDGYVPLRALAETGTKHQNPYAEYPPIGRVAEVLKRFAYRAAKESRGLYVVPATVAAPGSAKASDIISTAVVLIDIDEGDIALARDHLVTHLGAPTMEVASGGTTAAGQTKLHLYWQLTLAASGRDLERIRALREIIARKVGGDHAFASLHQPIRVAGTIHGKNGTQRLVRLLERRPVAYILEELEEAVGAMPSLMTDPTILAALPFNRSLSHAVLATKVVNAGSVDDLSRFEALSRVIGHWVRQARTQNCTLGEARQAVSDHNAAMIRPAWDEGRLTSEFDAIMRRDIQQRGPMPEGTIMPLEAVHVELSEDALAAHFVDQNGDDWRFVAAWGTWFRWTGRVWANDETGAVREEVRLVCRAVALRVAKQTDARRIASDRTIAAVLRIVASDPAIAVPDTAWDNLPMHLNTPTCVIDLKTGKARTHDRKDFLTQSAAASPGTGCPRWIAFVEEITGGNPDLVSYLQRLAGYALSGSTREQMFAFFHGAGANGKSVFIQTLAEILGTYAATATLDTFMATHNARHLSELAGLRAARLVVVPETEVGRSWSEARIKTVTGGELIRANFMHRDYFEYRPQFKLVVAGNHRPALSTVSEAMRRRLHVVPFDVTFAAEARDTFLAEKLRIERDGILGWMLEGCAAWQRMGLAPPSCMLKVANDYFAEEDLVGQWIEAACQLGPDCRATASSLFGNWSAWAEAGGHAKGSGKTLGEALGQRGFKSVKLGGHRARFGIALRSTTVCSEATE